MTAGHGQGAARVEHPRSLDVSMFDGLRDAGLAATDVAHRGKSAVERML
jgi:hypothetical protein